jgi:anhydro-N-acetylmuramic acid kinase
VIVIGLISGTSVDGIHAAVCRIEGAPPDLQVELLHFTKVDFQPDLRSRIFRAFSPDAGTVDLICSLNFEIGEAFACAALAAVDQAGLAADEVDLVGSHGQTIHHLPNSSIPSTLQIGEAAVIAERTGICTVADFRVADMAAGGQGAPLVSYVDYLLFSHEQRTRAVQNIGGIANVTLLPADCSADDVLAFDTGPGNMVIDHAARRATDGRWHYDHDGKLASQGEVSQSLLEDLMGHAYLWRSPPKTTGREEFGSRFGDSVWHRGETLGLTGEDIVATVTAYTACSMAHAYQRYLPPVQEVILGGGGSHNPVLRNMIERRVAPAKLLLHEDFGVASDAKEALAFAVLAYESWHGRPGNLPSATGAAHPVVLGKTTPGRRTAEER